MAAQEEEAPGEAYSDARDVAPPPAAAPSSEPGGAAERARSTRSGSSHSSPPGSCSASVAAGARISGAQTEAAALLVRARYTRFLAAQVLASNLVRPTVVAAAPGMRARPGTGLTARRPVAF